MTLLYDETIAETLRVSKQIGTVPRQDGDGRIASAMQETPFLLELKRLLLETHPTWEVVISPPRASCDILINSVRINLKLTDCKSADNSMNKPAIFFSITGLTTYPYSSTWNDFLAHLTEAKKNKQIKRLRDCQTEYHYLVKNKLTGEVLLKPIFDIHTYISNPSNDLQINWKHEFSHATYSVLDTEYLQKVQSLLECIQKSVREMIARTQKFADAVFSVEFLSSE